MHVKSENMVIYRTAATPAIIFAHGKESGPWGEKIRSLANIAKTYGYEVESPDFRGIDDPEERLKLLLNVASRMQGPFILVGSSMGGYVSLLASQQLLTAGLFLMAPAVGLPGYLAQQFEPGCKRITIIHAWQDEIIPHKNVIEFAESHHAELYLVNSDHRLSGQIPLLELLFSQFLKAGTLLNSACV